MSTQTKRIAYLALLAALTLVLGYLDAMIPLPVTIPGVKLGLANITVIIALYLLGPRYSFAVMLIKVAVTSLLIGSPSMVIYSFGGSILAFLGMYLLWLTKKINLYAISIVSAVLHNLGQLTVATIVLQTPAILLNLPIMVIAACITGGITGAVAHGVLKALPPLPSPAIRSAETKKSDVSEQHEEVFLTEELDELILDRSLIVKDSVLVFDNVSFSYPDSETKVIDTFSYTIPQGKRVALLGFNGSGKSTLAQLANGLLLPGSGQVALDGVNTSNHETVRYFRKRVGVVAQDPDSQIVASTVVDDTAFGLENIGLPPDEIEDRARKALSDMGLSEYENRDPNALSGGEKQRLVIAGILAMEPDFIVLDEPSSMLDAVGRKEVLEAIDDLHAKGHGILHITHDLDEALATDEILVLESGKIIFTGTPSDFMADQTMIKRFSEGFSPYLQLKSLLGDIGRSALEDTSQSALKADSPWHPQSLQLEEEQPASPSWMPSSDQSPSVSLTSDSSSVEALRNDSPSTHSQSFAFTGAPKLTLSEVAFSYGKGTPNEKRALQDIDFRLTPGAFTLISGRSGSGKSTLLRIASGLLAPDQGSASISDEGIDPQDTAAVPIEPGMVGIVFQQPESQLFAQTVYEDIIFGPKNIGLTDSPAELERLARESLEAVGLDFETFAQRSPFSLSGGEARRVAIATILAMKPRFMLFDEPTAGLDFKGRAFIHQLIDDLLAQDVGIAVISHDLDEFLPRVHEVLLLDEGKVGWDGDAKTLIGDPDPLESVGLDLPPLLEFQKQLKVEAGSYSFNPEAIARWVLSDQDRIDAASKLFTRVFDLTHLPKEGE